LNKQKAIVITISLIIIGGLIGGIIYTHFYPLGESNPSTISIIDDSGRNVTITTYPPERIVSIMPVCTEIACALGLENKIVGVDEISDYPPVILERVQAGTLKTLGDPTSISIESLLDLNPDLVLSDHGKGQSPTVQRLEELGIPVVVLHPKNIDEIISDILVVGEITGKTVEAEELVENMQTRIDAVMSKTQNLARPRIYVEYYFNGGYWTVGSTSFITELIYKAGGTNVFADFSGEYLSTSTEEVLGANPEIIIISQGSMSQACGLTPTVIKQRIGWGEIPAVLNDELYEIDENIVIRPGPRIVDGLEAFAKVIHPEVFD
jgi:iron complex transport system substrate-binding protein